MFKLTEKQQEIINSPAQVKLVIGGYRSGKTVLAIMNMWNYMNQFRNPNFRCAFLVNSDSLWRFSLREFKRLIPNNNIINTIHKPDRTIIETEFGEIIISTRLIPVRFDNITIDNASSNRYVAQPEILKERGNIYVTGHLPDDIDNPFFKWWLKEYFSNTKEISAFRISETFMDIKDKEERLITSIGVSKFNRNYKAIPDYMDYDFEKEQQMFRREYLVEFIDKVENNEISFNPKTPFFMGFDKAKED